MLSLHELSVVPALRLEALAGRTFADVTVFGVEPADVAWGDTLSPAVAGAMDRLVGAVLDHVARALAAAPRHHPGAACACTLAGDRSL
jgi:Ni,Fe-hydrogenase maturation factor